MLWFFSSSSSSSFFVIAGMVTVGIQGLGFLVAVLLQTEIFYDILGGVNFLTLAALGYYRLVRFDVPLGSTTTTLTTPSSAVDRPLTLWFLFLFVLSRGWLLCFLAWRAHQRKGDSRFDGVRNVPSRFVLFWIVQGVWVYCISTPLLLVVEQASHPFTVTSATTTTNNNTDDDANPIVFVLVLLGMTLAIVVEIASDITKARWVAHGRPGGYCVDGFWNFSRHPNYAGEIGTWVCAAVYAILLRQPDPASSSSSFFSCSGVTTVLLAALSPGVTLHLLCNTPATGIWHAEGKALKRYYEPTAVASPASSIHHPHAPINDDDDDDDDLPRRYATYWHTTPPIFPNLLEPLLPYEFLPVWIKRSFCFEWERYAYKTTKNRTTTTKPKTH